MPPGLHTLWGSHLPESKTPPLLAFAVVGLTLAGLAHLLAGEALGLQTLPVPRGFLGVVLPWTGALCALLIAVFAWGAWLTRGGTTSLVLAGTLPAVGVLAANGALEAWERFAAPVPGGVNAAAALWSGARLLLAAGLQLVWAEAWLERWGSGSSRRRWAAAGALLLAMAAVAFAVVPAAGRPWPAGTLRALDVVVLVLLLLAGPAMARLHRRHPNLLTHSLLLSLAPLAGTQVAALLSADPGNAPALLAQGLAVLAFLTLLVGVCLDFMATERAKARIQGRLRQATRDLESSTHEVQRMHGELVREQEEKARYHRRLRLLDRAVERMSVGLTITEPDGRIIYVNPADAAMHGYTPAELLGQPARIYGAPEAIARPPEVPVFWRRETLNRTRDGRIFPVRLISDAVLGDDGQLQALVTLCEDLTAVHQVLEAIEEAHEVLAAREADYHQLVEGASDLIQSVGQDGRYRFVNRAWLETLGYRQEEVDGLTAWDVVHPEHCEHCRTVLARIFENGGPERVETVFCSKTGREIHVEGSIGARSEQGRIVATLGIFRDISERRRVERMKQEFLATVSHELRTPLTSMLGSLSLVRGPRLAAQPEKAQELLEVAERNGDRLMRLINDLLDLQRLEAGELRFHLAMVDLESLLEEAVHDIQGFADLYNVKVRVETDSTTLVTDRHRLAQVLYNLLANAIKFSPAGEEILLAARDRGAAVELTVRDHGPGIPEEFRARLFEKFAQADASPVRRHGGSGLGLSISRKIVEGLGGTIALDSTPDAGTTVSIRLPRQAT